MENKSIKVIAIDDNKDNLITIKALIMDSFPEAEIFTATGGKEGIKLAGEVDPDVILLDVIMPEMDGFQVCKKLKASSNTCDIPVIFVTALKSDKESRIRALESGAEAFLSKPIDESELTAQIRAMVKIKESIIKSQTEKERLEELVQIKTAELKESYTTTLSLLEEFKIENSARKKSEEALKTTLDMFSMFMKYSPIYTYIKEVTASCSKIVKASDNYRDMIGISGKDMVGKTMSELFPEDFAEKITREDRKVLSNLKVLMTDEEFNGRNYSSLRFPILQEKRNLIGGYSIDVTDNLKMQDILQRTAKLDSLGILAGGIAHDFNNLLAGIFGYVDLALENTTEPKITDYLSKAVNTIERARGLTQQLLTFAKGGVPVKKIGKLFPFLEETAQFALSGSNILCNVDYPENLWPCDFDKNQISQVIDNLIINAKQAMPFGGTIEFSAENITFREEEHPVIAGGNYVKMDIKDQGTGIPSDLVDRIFDPFFTTKTQGHGLGLATSYSIIKKHGGYIDVESFPDKGTVFHIFMPALNREVSTVEKNSVSDYRGKGTIIVMDDEEVIRDICCNMLENLGFKSICLGKGEDVLEFIKSQSENFENIAGMIFDLTIPGGMDGKTLIKEIRKINESVPVFVSSGYADDPVMAHPENFGFTASLRKPFRINDLIKTLSIHLKD